MQVPDSTVTAPLSMADQLRDKIYQLRTSLQERLPNYESLLHTIHRSLAMQPDTVHLLSEEEIGIIVAGLSIKTNTFIAQDKAKKSVEKAKSGKGKIGVSDL